MVDTAKDLTGRELTGKVALVVGAGPGLGRACALAFARDGADVVVSARRAEPLAELAAEIAAETGRRVEPIVSDLSDLESLTGLVDESVARFGGIDALVTVATAGGGQIAIDEADWDVWRHAFQVNVIGTSWIRKPSWYVRQARSTWKQYPCEETESIATFSSTGIRYARYPAVASLTGMPSAICVYRLATRESIQRRFGQLTTVPPVT